MKRLSFWVALLSILTLAIPANSATYCVRADGTAGSKTAATDCLTVANCMTAAVHNAETFATPPHTILVCAHGGEFDATLTPPSSGTSGNEITYKGVPSGLNIPTFDDGFDANSQDFLIVQGIVFQPGVAESGTATFEGGRFADTSRSWQAAEETAVTNWDVDKVGIYAVGIGTTGGGQDVTPQLYWRNKTDAGSFAVVGATGEVQYSATTALTDNGNLATGNFGTTSGKSAVIGAGGEQEDSHQSSSATTLADNEFTELQVGVSFADADPEDEYEFSLYHGGVQVGSGSVATVTVDDFDDITFWLNWEACGSPPCTGTYTLDGTDEYSAGDTTGTQNETAVINTDAVQIGSVGLDTPTGGDNYEFTANSIVNPTEGRMGAYVYFNSFTNGRELLYVREDGSNHFMIRQDGTDELEFRWIDDAEASGGDNQTTNGANLSTGTWYYIEIAWDTTDNERRIYVDGNNNICGGDASPCVDYTGIGPLTMTSASFYVGEESGYNSDVYIDQIIVSNDETRDLNALKSLTKYPGAN